MCIRDRVSLELKPIPQRPDKPDEDIPSMLGDSVAQSSVAPLYRGRSLPSYATGSISVPPSQAPTYTSALTEVSEETIVERIQEQRRKEDDEMDWENYGVILFLFSFNFNTNYGVKN